MVSDCSPMFLDLKTYLIIAETLPRVPLYDGSCWVAISGSRALVESILGVLELNLRPKLRLNGLQI